MACVLIWVGGGSGAGVGQGVWGRRSGWTHDRPFCYGQITWDTGPSPSRTVHNINHKSTNSLIIKAQKHITAKIHDTLKTGRKASTFLILFSTVHMYVLII